MAKFPEQEMGTDTGENEYTKGTNTAPFQAAKQKKAEIPQWPEYALLPQPMDETYITSNGSDRKPLNWPEARRRTWYRTRLIDRYGEIVKYHAEILGLPPRLLATIILNELGDINASDVWQDKLAADASWLAIHGFDIMSASVGISQIQISTVQQDQLLMVHQDDYQAVGDLPGIPLWAYKAAIARKLTIPYWGIYAAATEISILINRVLENKDGQWASQFNITYPPVLSEYPYEIYNCIGLTDYEVENLDAHGISYDQHREAKAANMIHAAYNSPGIIIAQNPGEALGIGDNIDKDPEVHEGEPYRNGRIMGWYAMLFAYELFDMAALD